MSLTCSFEAMTENLVARSAALIPLGSSMRWESIPSGQRKERHRIGEIWADRKRHSHLGASRPKASRYSGTIGRLIACGTGRGILSARDARPGLVDARLPDHHGGVSASDCCAHRLVLGIRSPRPRTGPQRFKIAAGGLSRGPADAMHKPRPHRCARDPCYSREAADSSRRQLEGSTFGRTRTPTAATTAKSDHA